MYTFLCTISPTPTILSHLVNTLRQSSRSYGCLLNQTWQYLRQLTSEAGYLEMVPLIYDNLNFSQKVRHEQPGLHNRIIMRVHVLNYVSLIRCPPRDV